MESEGNLDDTLIMIFGDHGNHMSYMKSFGDIQQFVTERLMPLFLINTPPEFSRNNP